jgi:hypothetical protein
VVAEFVETFLASLPGTRDVRTLLLRGRGHGAIHPKPEAHPHRNAIGELCDLHSPELGAT